ncbi:alpha/beta fold hydrolase [Streptomyces sp. NPDC051987]|uniref:thioesterase II family protein n=1 Tax=Streptomyces sp. NPDC051987 TaxID=3155808 RepID=UPI0034449CF4
MSAQTVEPGTWLRRFHSAPPDAPLLVVLPHAGGSASYYQALSGELSGRIEVMAVQYPGRQDRYREEPVADLPTLARRVAEALEPLADRRLALFGHSMGALVGFETARLLERENRPVSALFVSARRAPARPPYERVHLLDDAELLAELRALGGTDERLLREEELLRLYLPVVRADYRALETYACQPGATVGCPVIGLAGESDPRVSVDDVAAWREHTTTRFDLRVFQGGHFYVEQRTAAVADTVAAVLTETARTQESR